MARHGNSRHLNRLASSRYPRVSRKIAKYLAKPTPGRHALSRSVALLVVLRDKLQLAANAREAMRVIKSGNIEVNGRRVRDEKYPVGFGDIIKILNSKESYKIGIAKVGDIKIDKIDVKEIELTLKVIGKYLGRGAKPMLRLYDGSTLEGEKQVKVNDSVVLDKRKISRVLKFEEGANCLVVKGAHASETGTIKGIKKGGATSNASVKVEGASGTFETPVENVMVVGA